MDDILKGAYDMHIHTSPDVSPRKSTDLEIAEEWKTAGMKGGVVKCHFADTTGRAAILSALYPDLKIYGGLVLNRQAGGINPGRWDRTYRRTGRGSCRAGGGEARREAPGADPCGESGDKFFHRRSETLRESRGDGGAQLLYSLPQPRELGACDRADPRGRNRQHVSPISAS